MKRFLAGAAACAAIAAPAMAADLNGFTGVHAAGNYDVEIVDGAGYAVSITGPDAARVRAEVRRNTLRVEPRQWMGDSPHLNVLVRVTMPRLDTLEASRGVSVRATDIDTQDMALAANTGGTLEINGTCTSLAVSVSTGGILNASDFRCDEASAAASTGGQARIYADDGLSASASTGGVIRVAGSPNVHAQRTSFGGEVRVTD